MNEESPQARLRRLIESRRDLIPGDDGYWIYWPTDVASRSALAAWELRFIADLLDKKNAPWDAVIHADPALGPPGPPPDTAVTLLEEIASHDAILPDALQERIRQYLRVLRDE